MKFKQGDIVRQTHDGSWDVIMSSPSRTGIAVANHISYKNVFVEWLVAENPSLYISEISTPSGGRYASFKPWMVSLYCPREKLFDGE